MHHPLALLHQLRKVCLGKYTYASTAVAAATVQPPRPSRKNWRRFGPSLKKIEFFHVSGVSSVFGRLKLFSEVFGCLRRFSDVFKRSECFCTLLNVFDHLRAPGTLPNVVHFP